MDLRYLDSTNGLRNADISLCYVKSAVHTEHAFTGYFRHLRSCYGYRQPASHYRCIITLTSPVDLHYVAYFFFQEQDHAPVSHSFPITTLFP